MSSSMAVNCGQFFEVVYKSYTLLRFYLFSGLNMKME